MGKMYRCRYLAHGLYIHYFCFRHCHLSIHSPNERNNNYIIPYTGPKDKVDWDEVFKQKKELVQNMRDGNIPPFCKGCHWIEEFDENSENQFLSDFDPYIDMIWIGHTNKCNANCIYCFSHQEILEKRTYKPFDIFPLFKELLDKKIYNLEKEPNAHISFAMGEPTILKKFEDIIKIFEKSGNKCFAIYTNGIKTSKMLINTMKKENTDVRIVISLDAGSREIFKKVKKVDKFKDACKTIQAYTKAAKIPDAVGVKYIIIPNVNDNKEEIDKWYDLCTKKLGVKFLIADIEEKWFVRQNGDIPEYVKDLLRYIRSRCQQDGIQFEFFDRALVLNL